MPDVNNIYQLLALVVVAGLQAATTWGVNKLSKGQSQLRGDIESTRVEMFRMANLSDAHVIRSEGHMAGVAATIEAALKVAYLQGKVDAKGDVSYPQERITAAARKLAEVAIRDPEAVAKLQQPGAPSPL